MTGRVRYRWRRRQRLTLPPSQVGPPAEPQHDPKGLLRLDWPDHACIDCHEPFLRGEYIVQIKGEWWHQFCRDRALALLREEWAGGDA